MKPNAGIIISIVCLKYFVWFNDFVGNIDNAAKRKHLKINDIVVVFVSKDAANADGDDNDNDDYGCSGFMNNDMLIFFSLHIKEHG